MTLKLSERELERLLRGEPGADLRPPEGLLARLRSELPQELPVESPAAAPAKVLRPAFWQRSPLLVMAATLAVVVGGSLLAYRTMRATAPPALEASPPASAKPASPQADTTAGGAGALADSSTAAEPLDQLRQDGALARAAQPAAAPEREAGPRPAPTPAAAAPKSVPIAPVELKEAAEASRLDDPLAAAATGGVPGEVPGGTAAAPQEDELVTSNEAPPPSPAAPPRLESPGIEGNSTLRDLAELRQLQSPTVQGDLGKHEPARAAGTPAAPAAAPPAFGGAADADADNFGDGWRQLERTLASGRWPLAAEVAALRRPAAPEKDLARARQRTAEKAKQDPKEGLPAAELADPVLRLREDLLVFLGRETKPRAELQALRERALELSAKDPADPRCAALLRTLNLAEQLLPR